MYDLHSHILPSIDDGSKNMQMSLAMLEIAAKNGTKGIVATPHVIEGEWLPSWDKIMIECDILQKIGQDKGIDLRIFPGGEVAIYHEILDLLKGPGDYCINNGRYLLVELPASHIPSFTEEFFFTLQARGIMPILAHPERHTVIAQKPELLVKWIRNGVLTQMNGTSITGLMGKRVSETAELLLTNNMIHVIGSDAHGITRRNTNLTSAFDTTSRLIGTGRAEQLFVINPKNIINNQEVDIPEIDDLKLRRTENGIINWIFKFCKSKCLYKNGR